jgi:hypothetical protein
MSLSATGGSTGGRALKKVGWTLLTAVLILFLAFLAYHQFLVLVGRTPHAVAETNIAGRRVAMWKPAGKAPRQNVHPPLSLCNRGLMFL